MESEAFFSYSMCSAASVNQFVRCEKIGYFLYYSGWTEFVLELCLRFFFLCVSVNVLNYFYFFNVILFFYQFISFIYFFYPISYSLFKILFCISRKPSKRRSDHHAFFDSPWLSMTHHAFFRSMLLFYWKFTSFMFYSFEDFSYWWNVIHICVCICVCMYAIG